MYFDHAPRATRSGISRCRIPLSRDPYYQESVYEARNPRYIETTDEWFRRNPTAKCRIVASSSRGGKFVNITFYPRKGLGCELLAEQMRDILAERFSTGTLSERIEQVFYWLKAGGCFPKAA